MATLAESFLADLEDLSEDEEDQIQDAKLEGERTENGGGSSGKEINGEVSSVLHVHDSNQKRIEYVHMIVLLCMHLNSEI